MPFGDTIRCKCGIMLFTNGQRRAAHKILPSGDRRCLKCFERIAAEVRERRSRVAACTSSLNLCYADASGRLQAAMNYLDVGDIGAADLELAAASASIETARNAVEEALAK